MTFSSLWTAVLTTTAIYTADSLFTHHTTGVIYADLMNNPGFSNWTDLWMNTSYHVDAVYNATYRTASAPVTLPTANRLDQGSDDLLTNLSVKNAMKTTAAPSALSAAAPYEESFYKRSLPISMIAYLVLSTLQYCWLIWLERILPARSRRQHVPTTEKLNLSEDHEEEIVKKWVAQGRVRRASLNWCNTFLKWVLGLTIGRVWWIAVFHVVQGSLRLESPRDTWGDMFNFVATNYAGSFLSITPFAELISLIVLPAYKQMVFVAGMQMLFGIFFTTVARALSTWAVQTEFAQAMLRNATEGMAKEIDRRARKKALKTEL